MEGWLLFGLIIIGLLVAAPVMAAMALARTRATQQELEQLKFEVVVLRRRLSDGETRAPAPAKPSVAPMPERVAAPETAPVAKPEPAVAKAPEPPRQSAPSAAPATPPVAPVAATDWAKTSASIERMIAANWLVWVGGAALALGGIFLVRYALEQGWFGPLPRTIAAVIAGLAMIAGSEWLRRRTPDNAIGQIGYAPLVVAAAGAVTLYGAAYAAGPLYHFLSPELTLAGFVAASAVAVGLAVIHGAFLAALGLAGGYVAPLLVGGGTPGPTLLLAYAFAVTLACLVLVRAFDWRRIVWVALLGAGTWMMFGVGMVGLANGPIAVAGYGLALLFAANAFAWSDADAVLIARRKPDEPALPPPNQTLIVAMGFWIVVGVGLLVGLIPVLGERGDPLLVALGVYGAAAIFAGWRKPAFEIVPLFGAAVFLLGCLWTPVGDGFPVIYGPDGALIQAFGAPVSDINRFVAFGLAGALACGLGGWFAMRGLRYPTAMAAVSAVVPLGLLVIAFHKLGQDQQHFSWGLAGGLIALLNLLALEGMRRSARGLDGAKGAASAYALAAFAGSMFAVGSSLGQMWMTVLFALHLPAIAMIDRRFNLDALKLCASIAAMVVMARLLMPGEILSYPISTLPVFNELTALYGASLLCFWGAARLFAVNLKSDTAPLVEALDVGALTLLTVLAGLLVRHAVTGGDLAAGAPDLVEMSAYAVTFASLALGLYARRVSGQRPVLGVAVDAVYLLAAVTAVLGLGLLTNPLLTASGGRYLLDGPPLLNLLASSYLPPVALFGVHALLARRQGRVLTGNASGFIAVALVFLYLSLEVRNAFHVDLSLRFEPITEAESYAYSITWLLFAIAILIVGMARKSVAVRHVAMAVLALSVAKVFVFDMASLTGVLRAASFMGLGVALIGIAYLYQRVVFRREASSGQQAS